MISSPVPLSAVVSLRQNNKDPMFPTSFPPAIPCSGTPFPPPGSLGRFPDFVGTMACSETPSSFSPRFVAFAWRYHAAFLLRFRGCETQHPRTWRTLRPAPRWSPYVETTGFPRFLGNPYANAPRSLTPVGRYHLAMTMISVLPSALPTASASTTI